MAHDPYDLAGRVALVTGAGRGIGWAIAKRLLAAGAQVMALDLESEAARAAIRALGEPGSIRFWPCDLGDVAAVRAVVPRTVELFGRVDLLVNNAATDGELTPLVDDTPANWAHVLQVNLIAAFVLAQGLIRHLKGRGAPGRIVNITAIQAETPLPKYGAYAASKGGLISLTKSLAVEHAADGILANAVEVGCVYTEGVQEHFGRVDGAGRQQSEARAQSGGPADPDGRAATLTGRFGRPEEIADLVAFLLSDANRHLAGAVIRADGGRTISRKADPFL